MTKTLSEKFADAFDKAPIWDDRQRLYDMYADVAQEHYANSAEQHYASNEPAVMTPSQDARLQIILAWIAKSSFDRPAWVSDAELINRFVMTGETSAPAVVKESLRTEAEKPDVGEVEFDRKLATEMWLDVLNRQVTDPETDACDYALAILAAFKPSPMWEMPDRYTISNWLMDNGRSSFADNIDLVELVLRAFPVAAPKAEREMLELIDAPPPARAYDEARERALFEQTMDYYKDALAQGRRRNGEYQDSELEQMWRAWLARAKLAKGLQAIPADGKQETKEK